MTSLQPLFLGFDPGGDRAFGVAILHDDQITAATVSSVGEAMRWALEACGDRAPIAAGIDTLLHWGDGAGGWRPADNALRATYPAAQSSVISANSLFGAMGVGGMALALRLRQQWPDILLNETHPKVLAYALRGERHVDNDTTAALEWFATHSGLRLPGKCSGHALDAVLSAWATREGLAKGWPDLVADDDALIFPAGKVSYLWPELLAARPRDTTTPAVRQPRTASAGRGDRGTTAIGYRNRHGQIVIWKTDLPGTDHGQRIYVLRCDQCGHEYGANGSDIFIRRCPKHGGGRPELPYDTVVE